MPENIRIFRIQWVWDRGGCGDEITTLDDISSMRGIGETPPGQGLGREMPSFLIREWSVVGGKPRISAAPCRPRILQ